MIARLNRVVWLALLALLTLPLPQARATPLAQTPPQPGNVSIPGSYQSKAGCSGDWQPECPKTQLAYDAAAGVWRGEWTIPAGSFEYKVAIDNAWTENYGLGAVASGPNIPLKVAAGGPVKFYYDHETHWVADNQTSVIATLAGSFQSEVGCANDWEPGCLRSWLQDPDGDGVYTYTLKGVPAGSYEAKVAIDESWDENYGAGGARGGANIAFDVPAATAELIFRYDSSSHMLSTGGTRQRGSLAQARAHWVTRDTLAWRVAAAATNIYRLHYAPDAALALDPGGVQGGQALTLGVDAAGLPQAVLDKFPHLKGYTALKIAAADVARVPEILKGRVAVSASGGGQLLDASAVQIPGVLDDLFAYDGPLGITWQDGAPTLRLWAPTARSVKLHLFAGSSATAAARIVAPAYDPASGVWTAAGQPEWKNQFYLYEVEVFSPASNKIERNLVTDPYSVSLAANSTRSQIVDLADPGLKPDAWDTLVKPPLAAPEDIVLYELHVRDFSAGDATVPQAHRGGYLAFTARDSNGMKHLKALAGAGLTHIHLLPVFDIATIRELRSEQKVADESLLAGAAPDSQLQQQTLGALGDSDAFNWGYDPYHYGVPEGSYATDPDGSARIEEFRRMVQGLNDAGLRVVLDVVYNHTSASGQDAKSVLDRVVPGYYHRLNADGKVETSTCCQNTATEHAMMEKLMIDTLVTWARAYKVDGFRFDLMGHHMLPNMTKARDALRALTLAHDGVDGSKIYLYGEGWNFGEVQDNARGANATQGNIAGTGIGVFNDRLRDGARGGGPFSGLQEQGFVTGLALDANGAERRSPAGQAARLLEYGDWIRLGLAGNLKDYSFVDARGRTVSGEQLLYNGSRAGYTADPQENINYVEAHDNETLWDAIALKAPTGATIGDRVRMQNLGLDLVMLGQGVPFFHAGADMLRSKSLDRNSYNSGDWFNRLDFSYQANNWGVGLPPKGDNERNWPLMGPLLANPALKPRESDIRAAVAHFQEMLRVRKSSPLFRLQTADDVKARLSFLNTGPQQVPGLIVMRLTDSGGTNLDPNYQELVVLFNAAPGPQTFAEAALRGANLVLHPIQAASSDTAVRGASFTAASGTFSVPGRTTAVFVAAENDNAGAPPAVQPGAAITGTVSPAASGGQGRLPASGQTDVLSYSLLVMSLLALLAGIGLRRLQPHG